MPKIETPATAIVVRMQCDDCNQGFMKPSGIVLTSNPPQYPHTCNSCGVKRTYRERYPFTYHKLVEEN